SAEALKQLECSLAAGGIHAHIKRPLLLKGKAALGSIELGRARADIGEDPIHLGEAFLDRRLSQRAERALSQDRPPAKGREPRRTEIDRERVAIDREEPPARRAPLKDRRRMPSATKGAIDVATSITRKESVDRLLKEHGDMMKIGHSPSSARLSRSAARSSGSARNSSVTDSKRWRSQSSAYRPMPAHRTSFESPA